ncbi:MAG: amidohydrolase family protein [Phycisphaerales bacterium]|nr:amidohydrolase family protein [Phycisphaerales bacterium]
MTISKPTPLLPSPTPKSTFTRINTPLIADANQSFAPGSLILAPQNSTWKIHAIGHPAQIDTISLPTNIKTIDLPNQIIIPALINAHTHLDLTHIGPQPHDPHDPNGGFVPWLDMIRANRLLDDAPIAASVNLGIKKSLAGGTIAVGDIAGAPNGILKDTPITTLAKSPLQGTSYLEFFGIGKTAKSIIHTLDQYLTTHLQSIQKQLQNTGVTFGLSPHATNTISITVYQWAAQTALKHNIPLSTHLAETLEERQFISKGTGPQRGFLERFGIWDDSILKEIGNNQHPIDHLLPILNQLPILCAHVNDAPNDAPDQTIAHLAKTKTAVAYCPRAHTYFGHYEKLGPHPFEKMLKAGINVSLGTDSIVNLKTPNRITTLDDMRLLATRDGTSMQTLLKMTTTNPANALNLNPNSFTITQGTTPAGLLTIPITPSKPPWQSAMHSKSPPTWLLFQPKFSGCPYSPSWGAAQ